MTAQDLVGKLKLAGYSLRHDRGDILLKFTGQETPDPSVVAPLLEELKRHKQDVLGYILREIPDEEPLSFLWQLYGKPEGSPEPEWRRFLKDAKQEREAVRERRDRQAYILAENKVYYAHAVLNYLRKSEHSWRKWLWENMRIPEGV